MTEISVIICTHNPREAYLARVVEALKQQTLEQSAWELIVVDNGSVRPLKADAVKSEKVEKCESGKVETWEGVKVDLGWHANARIVREEELGLTQARLRGIAESKGELLVFVDDDNVLRADYLEQAVSLAKQWPQLGAWSGRVAPEYEVEPAEKLQPYLWMLCIRPIEKSSWGNEGTFESTPWGAGMCVRRKVAEKYAEAVKSDVFRISLDRRGESLGSTGDIDLALTSLDVGLGTGVFVELELAHLMPARRVAEDYLLKLIEDGEAGYFVFQCVRGGKQKLAVSRVDRLVEIYKQMRGSRLEKAIADARSRGRKRGESLLAAAKTSL